MKYSGIGGQAVMEGVMMRNGDKYAVAVRKPNKEIAVVQDEYKGVAPKAVYKIPFVRGVFSFVDSLVLGMKTLNISTEYYMEDEQGKKEEKSAGDSIMTGVIMVISMAMAIGLFTVLPYFASQIFNKIITNQHLLALVEGLIRMLVFVLYILAISQMQDIKRVFMYHGAEHKCINCLESGMPLTVENVRKASREHRRCGTSFLLYVMVISVLFFAMISSPNPVMKVVMRLVLVPVIAGVSFEFIRLAGKSNNALIRAFSIPGLLMQKLTTSEPDDEMIEIGIASVEAIFDWKKYLEENF
ncbi:MAG: DUF1385 domain-containing protein [Lachnospiraceae bacterium]|nr:DUF1385 domain-containing protein [Lachnospiraceae bacterium]